MEGLKILSHWGNSELTNLYYSSLLSLFGHFPIKMSTLIIIIQRQEKYVNFLGTKFAKFLYCMPLLGEQKMIWKLNLHQITKKNRYLIWFDWSVEQNCGWAMAMVVQWLGCGCEVAALELGLGLDLVWDHEAISPPRII